MLGRRYQLERELGRGASGAVYRGRDLSNGRLVAVKILNAGPCEEPGFLVTPYAHGRDLRNHIRPGRLLALQTVLSIVALAADALAFAHARGAVHGDLSPSNIVYHRASGAVKLIDAAESPLGGTPAYMSPEQVRGLPIGPASDQFSLGVVLYRLACGRLPFSASSRPQLAHRIVNEAHADIHSIDSSLPATLGAMLDRALAKLPAARFPSTAAFAGAVRDVTAGLLLAHPARAR